MVFSWNFCVALVLCVMVYRRDWQTRHDGWSCGVEDKREEERKRGKRLESFCGPLRSHARAGDDFDRVGFGGPVERATYGITRACKQRRMNVVVGGDGDEKIAFRVVWINTIRPVSF